MVVFESKLELKKSQTERRKNFRLCLHLLFCS